MTSSSRLSRWGVCCGACWLAVTAACSEPRRALEARAQAIYYGEPEDDYDGVVLLTISLGGLGAALCTGTLVAPRVVTTAKHCVLDEAGELLEPSAIWVDTGPTGRWDRYAVEEIRPTAGSRVEGRDFAVLILQDEVDAEPYAYAASWQPARGDPITLVGYGQRDDGDAGTKYRGDNEIDYIFANYFTTEGEGACHGDSGGPAFDADGVLVGVIVNTLGGWAGEDACAQGLSGITRVDAWHEIVDEAVDDAWVCDHADQETCGDERDNDCDRVIDNGCLALGDLCPDPVFCESGDCRALDDEQRCTSSCAPGEADGCPAGFYCDEIACGDGACRIGEAGGGPIGAACEDDTECQNLACIDAGDGGHCLRPCTSADDCPDGETCAGAEELGCGGCAPSGDGAPFGAACLEDADCASDSCAEDAFGSVCSTSCTDTCPDGFACDDAGRCLRPWPGGAGLGDPCHGPSSCESDLCGDFTDGAACTEFCADADPCPAGFACVEVQGVSLCEPSLAIAGAFCRDGDDCLSGLCGNFEEFRACTAACGPDAPCPEGLVCQVDEGVEGYCRPLVPPEPPADDEDEGGCGCRAPGRAAPDRAWVPIVVLLGVVLRRRGARTRKET